MAALGAALIMVLASFPVVLRAGEQPFSLLSSGQDGVRLTFELPAWSLEPFSWRGADYTRIEADGAEVISRPGYPSMPCYSVALVVPPGCAARGSISGEDRTFARTGALFPALAPPGDENESRESLSLPAFGQEYLQGGEHPEEPLVLSGPFQFREYRVLQLTVYPFSYDPSNGRLTIRRRMDIDISFSGQLSAESNSPSDRPDGLADPFVRGAFLNWRSAGAWLTPRTRLAASSASPFDRAPHWAAVRIDSSGVYSISGAALLASGVEISGIAPSSLRLYFSGGKMQDEDPSADMPDLHEVAIRVTGVADGSFGQGDRVIFYGQGLDRFSVDDTGAVSSLVHRYDNRAVYWLSWGDPGASGLRMQEIAAIPDAAAPAVTSGERWFHFERNNIYLSDLQGEESKFNLSPDFWAWVETGDSPDIRERTLNVPAVPLSNGNKLRCQFYGKARYASVYWNANLNGMQLGFGNTFDARIFTTDWLNLPENCLIEGGNRFILSGLNWITGFVELRMNTALVMDGKGQVEYHVRPEGQSVYQISEAQPRETEVYDITRPGNPVLLTGLERNSAGVRFSLPSSASPLRSFVVLTDSAYAAPASIALFDPPGLRRMSGAEYVVITPRALSTQAGSLAASRAARFSTQVVTVEDIYDEFGLGQKDPAAVRNFLHYAFDAWPVRPRFAVLFGDGHNDFRGWTGEGRARPNHIIPYISSGDVAYDEWFVRFESGGLPQISLGRIPVQKAADASVVADKVARYEQGGERGDWVRRVILSADDGYVSGGACDDVSGHVAGSESIDSLLPEELVRKKVYLDSYPFDPPEIGSRKPSASRELVEWWNRGALLVNYIGHGGPTQWSQELLFDVERDLPLLTNGYKLPLVLNSSCSIGYFDSYRTDAMAERLLTASGGGAIAVYAGTRVTYAGQNLALNRLLVQKLFGTEAVTLGEAALQARLGMGSAEYSNSAQYTVFGDPALLLHSPAGRMSISLDGAGQLKPGGKAEFSGSVLNNGGQIETGFSGVAQIKFLSDSRKVTIPYQCYWYGVTTDRAVQFVPAGSVLFDGGVTVSGGRFSGAFIMPLNLSSATVSDSLAAGSGRFIGYSTSESIDASGAGQRMQVSGRNAELSDSAGPEIRVLYKGRELRDGDRISKGSPLILALKDESGINTTGSPGYQVALEVDAGTSYSTDLTPYFRYNTDSYQEGSLEVSLNPVSEGLHSFRFRAADNALNASRTEIMLYVSQSGTSLSLANVLNYPNPFRDETDICFDLGSPADVLIRIFSVAGRPVRELRMFGASAGFNRVRWDGRDEYQEKVANGVYLYKIICRPVNEAFDNTEEVEATGKALLSR